ncbi:MAG TPA: hypothetical protein PLQ43_11895 [Deltaproteobacteria bacterium]|nr:hypothetical protein [Deltaproteobacteria bacterium]
MTQCNSMESRSSYIRYALQVFLAAAVVMSAWGAMAAQSTSRVVVAVAPVDELAVSDAERGILLDLKAAAGLTLLEGDPDVTARLNYVHNAPGAKKITAEVLAGGMPAGTQDITLSVAVGSGPEVVVVSSGVPAGPHEVFQGLSRGAYVSVPVSYRASATAGKTSAGTYGFTVTFTSLDDQ